MCLECTVQESLEFDSLIHLDSSKEKSLLNLPHNMEDLIIELISTKIAFSWEPEEKNYSQPRMNEGYKSGVRALPSLRPLRSTKRRGNVVDLRKELIATKIALGLA